MKFIKLYESFHSEHKSLTSKYDKEIAELTTRKRKELEDCLVPLIDYGFKVKVNSPPEYGIDYFYVIASINYKMDDLEDIYSVLQRQFENIRIELDSYPELDKVDFHAEGRRGGTYNPINQSYYDESEYKNLLDKFKLLMSDKNLKGYVEMEITFSVL